MGLIRALLAVLVGGACFRFVNFAVRVVLERPRVPWYLREGMRS